LLSLLSELPKSKASSLTTTKSTSILGGVIESDNNTDDVTEHNVIHTSEQQEEQTKRAPESLSLGFAFITSTVETTKRKRNDERSTSDVRDIHASSSSQGPCAASSKQQAPVPAPQPQPSIRRTVPSMRRTAAPPTAANRVIPPASTIPDFRNTQPAPLYTAGSTNTSAAAGSTKNSKKMSRKRQMEQMLRAGKIDEFQGDHEVQASANMYQPTDMDSGSSSSHNAHGVRVVPTGTYDVGSGTTTASTEVTGRQKNKHQLNSLLANAASLEAHRVQNPHLGSGPGGSGTGGSHRSTAKRKYGW
jgi:hypothetical protein